MKSVGIAPSAIFRTASFIAGVVGIQRSCERLSVAVARLEGSSLQRRVVLQDYLQQSAGITNNKNLAVAIATDYAVTISATTMLLPPIRW